MCLAYGVFPSEFKLSTTVVIPKPNKPDYSVSKVYRPIVLLNCLGKLMEKTLAQQMQFDAQAHDLVSQCQFGGLKAHSTTDAVNHLMYKVK